MLMFTLHKQNQLKALQHTKTSEDIPKKNIPQLKIKVLPSAVGAPIGP